MEQSWINPGQIGSLFALYLNAEISDLAFCTYTQMEWISPELISTRMLDEGLSC